MVRPVIHSVKHYVQQSINTVTLSTNSNYILVAAEQVSGVDTVNEVQEGALVKAVYVEAWLRAGDTANASFVLIVEKVLSGAAFPTTAQMAALGSYPNKKNVFFTAQALVNNQNSDAIPVLRQWIKIPKTKQRFGLKDKLVMTIFAQGAIDLHECGFATYKEYT